MPVYPQTFSFRDSKGQTAKVSMFISEATPAAALTAGSNIFALLPAVINANALQSAKGAYTTSPTVNTYGGAAEFPTIEDKAVLVFQTSTGAIHRYQIPTPLRTIFMADGETVDPANTDVLALTAAFVANHVCSRDGSLIASYIGGTRRRTKLQRKFNIFTLNPAETGPGE